MLPSLTALPLGALTLAPRHGAGTLTLAANASWDTSSHSFLAPKSLPSLPLTYAHALTLAPNTTAGVHTQVIELGVRSYMGIFLYLIIVYRHVDT
jgi:hypothetical protein